ncbi:MULTISPECIES: LemA family protein [Vibrio]|uniref:LemA family protein n=1 Tax=Vibrio TaxID=662 RepID=UPI000636724D|nr:MULTISPECIES: LemA family protein [Vibrio]PMI76696.1 hypothetical protein BCU38_00795 [Vibrio splendidus]CDT63134.1 LemA protein [Vibrio coralliirubri]
MEQYFIIFAGIFIIIFIISSYNKIISHHRTVIQSWDDVTVTERQKLKILPELQKMLEEHKIHESSLLSKITELRSSVAKISSDNIDPSQCEELSKASSALIKNLQVVSENYPEMRSSESFSKMMDEIVNQEEHVGAALRVFNQNVSIFNTTIESFPTNLVNGCTANKTIVASFKDSAAEESFEYKPNF